MRTYTPKKSRLQVESLEDRVALAGGFATLNSLLPAAEVRSAQGGGAVLPATARPYGYSLTDMARETAPFLTSGNTTDYPNTPFQVLYFDPSTYHASTSDGGVAVTGSNRLQRLSQDVVLCASLEFGRFPAHRGQLPHGCKRRRGLFLRFGTGSSASKILRSSWTARVHPSGRHTWWGR